MGELFTDYSDHPRKLVTLNPNSNQQAPDATGFFPVGGMPTAKARLGLEGLSPKSQDAVALQQIKERGALPMIDRGDIQKVESTVAAISQASLPGAGYGRFEHKADSLIAKKIQRSEPERSERLMYEQRVTAIISTLVITIIVYLSWAVNHYRDNAITYKAQRDKNARELKLANATQLLTCRCVSVMFAALGLRKCLKS